MVRLFLLQIIVLICKGQSQDQPCDDGKTCVNKDTCESFVSEQSNLKLLKKGTSERRFVFTTVCSMSQAQIQICTLIWVPYI